MSEPMQDAQSFETRPPIIDAARVPLRSFREVKATPGALLMFAWLHFLRPVALLAFWVLTAGYAYRHFFSLPMVLENSWLLLLYVSVILLMMGGMLYLAIHRIRHARHQRGGEIGVSVETVAESFNLPAEKLGDWQHARLLVAHHGDEGQLERVDVLVDRDGQLRRALRTKGRQPAAPSQTLPATPAPARG